MKLPLTVIRRGPNNGGDAQGALRPELTTDGVVTVRNCQFAANTNQATNEATRAMSGRRDDNDGVPTQDNCQLQEPEPGYKDGARRRRLDPDRRQRRSCGGKIMSFEANPSGKQMRRVGEWCDPTMMTTGLGWTR